MKNYSQPFYVPIDRRRFFKSMALTSIGFTLPGFLAEALTLSPTATQGPFYPLAQNIPLDKDNDLVQLNDNLTIASGIVSYINGRVLDSSGNPIRGALVELWHADQEGDYLYSNSSARNAACDANFAGFGQFLTGSDGRYLFRTIKAGLYNGRTRHLHWGITLPGETRRTATQTGWNEIAYDLSGHEWETQNSNDNVFSAVSNTEQRAFDEPTYPNGGSLVVAGVPVEGGRFKITIPAYVGYSYEVYANPTFADLGWRALPFSLSATGSIDRNIQSATSEGALDLYIAAPAEKGLYYVSFRVPGANTGTP